MYNFNHNLKNDDFIYDKVDLWLCLPCALTVLCAFLLFVPINLGVNVPLFILILYITVFSYQGRAKSESDRGSIYLLLIVLLASLPFILYDTSPFRILEFILLNFFVIFQIFTMYGCRYYKQLFSENWLIDAFNAVVFMPFANYDALWRVLKHSKPHVIITAAITFLAAPGALILLTHSYSSNFALCAAVYLLSVIVFLAVLCYIYGFLFGCRHARRIRVFKKPSKKALHFVPKQISILILSLLCLICAAYITAQVIRFLPVNGAHLTRGDLADYARQGFMELCIMVLVNLSSIAFTAVFTRVPETAPAGKSSCPSVLYLIVALCVLSVFLIATAFFKMLLYMKAYGLTTNRIITSFFMLGLAIVCIIIIARSFSPRVRIIRSISIATVTMFLILCFADCDFLALSYNRSAYISGQLPGFDIDMLYSCGDSIVPVMIDVYENSSGTIKTDAIHFLDHYEATYNDSLGKARSFNIASYNAHNKYIKWKNE